MLEEWTAVVDQNTWVIRITNFDLFSIVFACIWRSFWRWGCVHRGRVIMWTFQQLLDGWLMFRSNARNLIKWWIDGQKRFEVDRTMYLGGDMITSRWLVVEWTMASLLVYDCWLTISVKDSYNKKYVLCLWPCPRLYQLLQFHWLQRVDHCSRLEAERSIASRGYRELKLWPEVGGGGPGLRVLKKI